MASTSKTPIKATACLKTIIGNPVGEIFPLTSVEVTIGRIRSAQICIPDLNISRSHCVLKYSENGWFIKDLKSVNGTFLDEMMLETQKFYPLKDGTGIYLGPPGEAPLAFIFLTKMPNEQSFETNMKSCNQKSKRINSHIPVLASNKNDNKSMKRPSDSEYSNTNEGFSKRKKRASSSSTTATSSFPSTTATSSFPSTTATSFPSTTATSSSSSTTATSSSSSTTATSRYRDIIDEIEDVADLSDCSIKSLDSLKTRLRKLHAKSLKNWTPKKRDPGNAASSSASSQLNSSNSAGVESKPSTSNSASVESKPSTSNSASVESKPSTSNSPSVESKPSTSNSASVESKPSTSATPVNMQSSTPETIKGEDSESLLNDSKMLIDCDPNPFSQPLLTKAPKKGRNKNDKKTESVKEKLSEEQLKKATLQLKKLKKDKLRLSRLVKSLNKELSLKLNDQDDVQKLLEEELMCNICTEIYLKAVTLGCSHTFCEHCISKWKKNQKKCPICREKIASETKILVLDSFINKAADAETQKRRSELLVSRDEEKAAKQKKNKRSRGRGRRIRSNSSDADELRRLHGESFNNIGDQIRFSGNSSPSVQVIGEDDMSMIGSDFSVLSDGNDISFIGFDFLGSYGRCYNCGRTGHSANLCPLPDVYV